MLAPLTYILYAQSHCGHRRTLMPSRLANHFNHLWYVSLTIKLFLRCSYMYMYQQVLSTNMSNQIFNKAQRLWNSCFVETDYKRLRNALWEKLFIGQVYK